MAKKVTEKKAPAKKKAAPKKAAVELDPNKFYDFVCDKDTKHMKKGVYKNVDGVMCQVLTDKGLGSVKA